MPALTTWTAGELREQWRYTFECGTWELLFENSHMACGPELVGVERKWGSGKQQEVDSIGTWQWAHNAPPHRLLSARCVAALKFFYLFKSNSPPVQAARSIK